MILTKHRKRVPPSKVMVTEEGIYTSVAYELKPGEFFGVKEAGCDYEILVYYKKEARA